LVEEEVERMVAINCHDCDYEWNYTGELQQATCPNCGAKNKLDKNDQ